MIIFDIDFFDTNIVSVDINDILVHNSLYENVNNRISGNIIITSSMESKMGGNNYYCFVDFNTESLSSNYVIHKFMLVNYRHQINANIIVDDLENHTLIAIWSKNE